MECPCELEVEEGFFFTDAIWSYPHIDKPNGTPRLCATLTIGWVRDKALDGSSGHFIIPSSNTLLLPRLSLRQLPFIPGTDLHRHFDLLVVWYCSCQWKMSYRDIVRAPWPSLQVVSCRRGNCGVPWVRALGEEE